MSNYSLLSWEKRVGIIVQETFNIRIHFECEGEGNAVTF